MSRRGNCHEIAVDESFFKLPMRERIHRTVYRTRDEARQTVFEYIEMFHAHHPQARAERGAVSRRVRTAAQNAIRRRLKNSRRFDSRPGTGRHWCDAAMLAKIEAVDMRCRALLEREDQLMRGAVERLLPTIVPGPDDQVLEFGVFFVQPRPDRQSHTDPPTRKTADQPRSHDRTHAAVDIDDLAVDIVRCRRRQEHRRADQLLGLAPAL